MKALVVFDSQYGNTRQVAEVMAQVLKTKAITDSNFTPNFKNLDLLIVGSPTWGGRPTPKIQELLKKIPRQDLAGVKVTAFDTRFSSQHHSLGLKLLMKILGFASSRVADNLKAKGGKLITEPQGFIVKDKQGLLAKGELEKAKNWAKEIVRQIK